MAPANNYKVRLVSVASLIDGVTAGDLEQVVFDVTPKFSESRSVEYSPITPVHMPGSVQVYKHTNSRQFSIGATFISRTIEEATNNMIYLQTLRGWTLPYFGSTTTAGRTNADTYQSRSNQQAANQATNQTPERPLSPEERARQQQERVAGNGVELRGAPPDVLYLYAYSTSNNDGSSMYDGRPVTYAVNINRVPVVLSNLEITYPDDVDYLPTYTDIDAKTVDKYSEPFPMRMEVSLTLLETHSPREYEKFDLAKYKQGTLTGF